MQFRIDNATQVSVSQSRAIGGLRGVGEGGYTYNMNKATAHAHQHTDKHIFAFIDPISHYY